MLGDERLELLLRCPHRARARAQKERAERQHRVGPEVVRVRLLLRVLLLLLAPRRTERREGRRLFPHGGAQPGHDAAHDGVGSDERFVQQHEVLDVVAVDVRELARRVQNHARDGLLRLRGRWWLARLVGELVPLASVCDVAEQMDVPSRDPARPAYVIERIDHVDALRGRLGDLLRRIVRVIVDEDAQVWIAALEERSVPFVAGRDRHEGLSPLRVVVELRSRPAR